MSIALTAARLFTPLDAIDSPILEIEDGVITEVSSREEKSLPAKARHVDFGDAVLAPGLIDIHIHGGSGHDVMHADDDSLAAMEKHLAMHGVTTYFPTTMTAPWDDTLHALRKLGSFIATRQGHADLPADGDQVRARPMGIHLEGPFISHARRGVHPPENLVDPSLHLFNELWEASGEKIRMMTIAPELEGASAVIREARQRGICVSMGHSNADADSTYQAIKSGATHVTHTFNAMAPLGHREPGILGVALTRDDLTADIIADGVHVAPAILKMFLKLKGEESAVLISDAIAATGMPDGSYRLGPLEVEVRGRECRFHGSLAGSVLTLDLAVRNVMEMAHWGLQSAVRLATLNPALVTAIADRKGVLAAGRDADILVLTAHGQVLKTIAGGRGL